MTQPEAIKNLMRQKGWVCGSMFLDAHLSEYRSRLAQMVKRGEVTNLPCTLHKHQGQMKMWRLIAQPKPILNGCCNDMIIFGEHFKPCESLKEKEKVGLF